MAATLDSRTSRNQASGDDREFVFHQRTADALAATCGIDGEGEDLAFGISGLTGCGLMGFGPVGFDLMGFDRVRRHLARDYKSCHRIAGRRGSGHAIVGARRRIAFRYTATRQS